MKMPRGTMPATVKHSVGKLRPTRGMGKHRPKGMGRPRKFAGHLSKK